MTTSIKPIYRPYWEWEEVAHNMWGTVDDRNGFLTEAIALTGDHEHYGSWMKKVIDSWPNSCEHNLSRTDQNRKAWLGHAACALAFKCPEDIVREAWWHLTEEQRILANKQAEKYIKEWEYRQCPNAQLELTY